MTPCRPSTRRATWPQTHWTGTPYLYHTRLHRAADATGSHPRGCGCPCQRACPTVAGRRMHSPGTGSAACASHVAAFPSSRRQSTSRIACCCFLQQMWRRRKTKRRGIWNRGVIDHRLSRLQRPLRASSLQNSAQRTVQTYFTSLKDARRPLPRCGCHAGSTAPSSLRASTPALAWLAPLAENLAVAAWNPVVRAEFPTSYLALAHPFVLGWAWQRTTNPSDMLQ